MMPPPVAAGETHSAVGRLLGSFDSASAWDVAWLAKLGSLIVLPFAHEDVAIVFGAYCVIHKLMPVGLVVAGIYGGMVASDFALYAIGAGARRLPWLGRYAIDERVQRFGETLRRNVFGLVTLCRVVPGVVFVAFIACGWTRVPLGRFTMASLIVSAIYLPLVLYLAIEFGDALQDRLGTWTWPLLLIVMAVAGLARQRVLAFQNGAAALLPVPGAGSSSADRADSVVRPERLPSASASRRLVAAAERIPPSLFYLPLLANWIVLGIRHRSLTLPTAANPMIETGGMWGESKSSYFRDLAPAERRWVADFVVLRRERAAAADLDRALPMLSAAGISFPLVAKPDIGWHGYGVRLVENAASLHDYIEAFPQGETLILQRFVPHSGEAAIVYARAPDADSGGILSMTFRTLPHVVGDGRSAVRDLIQADARAAWKARLHLGRDRTHCGLGAEQLASVPARGELVQIAFIGNQRAGAHYRDASHLVTSALEQRFDDIARGMPEFHYGRFDIRYASAAALARGEDFSIVELNGIGGEAIDVWDPQVPIREVYRRLLAHQRLLFAIGDRNRARGYRPTPNGLFIAALRRQTQLIRHYPPSS
jgi:membrane protein DedA with SNARE-associated domain